MACSLAPQQAAGEGNRAGRRRRSLAECRPRPCRCSGVRRGSWRAASGSTTNPTGVSYPWRRLLGLGRRGDGQVFHPYEPYQTLLFPPSLRDWLPDGHLAHFVADTVDQLELTAFYDRHEHREVRDDGFLTPASMNLLKAGGEAVNRARG